MSLFLSVMLLAACSAGSDTGRLDSDSGPLVGDSTVTPHLPQPTGTTTPVPPYPGVVIWREDGPLVRDSDGYYHFDARWFSVRPSDNGVVELPGWDANWWVSSEQVEYILRWSPESVVTVVNWSAGYDDGKVTLNARLRLGDDGPSALVVSGWLAWESGDPIVRSADPLDSPETPAGPRIDFADTDPGLTLRVLGAVATTPVYLPVAIQHHPSGLTLQQTAITADESRELRGLAPFWACEIHLDESQITAAREGASVTARVELCYDDGNVHILSQTSVEVRASSPPSIECGVPRMLAHDEWNWIEERFAYHLETLSSLSHLLSASQDPESTESTRPTLVVVRALLACGDDVYCIAQAEESLSRLHDLEDGLAVSVLGSEAMRRDGMATALLILTDEPLWSAPGLPPLPGELGFVLLESRNQGGSPAFRHLEGNWYWPRRPLGC